MRGWQTFAMTPVLVTGMSGMGKSTARAELARRGFETVDTDDGDWIELVDEERLWLSPTSRRFSRAARRSTFRSGNHREPGAFLRAVRRDSSSERANRRAL